MITNLFLNIYTEQNEARRKELEICFENNLKAGFDHIWLFVEPKDEYYVVNLIQRFPLGDTTLHIRVVPNRPAFQEYITQANQAKDRLNVVFNSDIFIESSELEKLKSLPWEQKLYIALSRHELKPEGAFLLDRNDTADGFCFMSPCDVDNAWCPIGYPGIENSLAYKFQQKGYKVRNPSRSIQIMHLHNVGLNNYRVNGVGDVIGSQICPEPYAFHPPIKSDEI